MASPEFAQSDFGEHQRVTAGAFTPYVQSYLSNNPGHL